MRLNGDERLQAFLFGIALLLLGSFLTWVFIGLVKSKLAEFHILSMDHQIDQTTSHQGGF